MVLLIGGIGVANLVRSTDTPPTPRVTASPSPTQSKALSIGPTTSAGGDSPGTTTPTVTRVGHPILNVTGTWEVFARTLESVIRIELARGRITSTALPALQSSGPVSFIVGPDDALIRPLDNVPGYVVPDNRPVRVMTGVLARGGPVVPGPDPSRVWIQEGTDASPIMALVGLVGTKASGPTIALPPDLSPLSAQPDGVGSLMFQSSNGTYDARPDGLHRVTTGQVVAASKRTWLVSECDELHRCTTALVDRATGARRVLSPGLLSGASLGAVSPDGRLAAVPVGPYDSQALLVYNLETGARRSVPVGVAPAYGTGTIAWSPDGRWLLVVTSRLTLAVIDPTTWKVTSLGVSLPHVEQLAVRS